MVMGRQKQLYFSADDDLSREVAFWAAQRDVSVSAYLHTLVSEGVRRASLEAFGGEVMLELMPSVKQEFRRIARAANRRLEERVLRASFEASLSRVLITQALGLLAPGQDLAALVEAVLPDVEERLERPGLGLEAFLEEADCGADSGSSAASGATGSGARASRVEAER